MVEDKLLRVSLIASLFVNGLAVCALGFSPLLKPGSAPIVKQAKAKPTRLIEIRMLKEEKVAHGTSSGNAKGAGQAKGSSGKDDGSDDSGSASDSDDSSGKADSKGSGKLHKSSSYAQAGTLHHTDNLSKHQASKTHRAYATKGNGRKGRTGKADLSVNLKPNLQANLGAVHLAKPDSRVTGGFHGVIDLRNVKLKAHLIADIDPKMAREKQLPNKYIGKSHVKVVGKASSAAQCVLSIGGNTIYASDLIIYLGTGIELSGTKFCAPGAPGIPGHGSGQSRQSNSASSGHGKESSKYQGENVATKSRPEEGSSKSANGSGKNGRGSSAGDSKSDDPTYDAATGGGTTGTGPELTEEDDADAATQQGLQTRYEHMATGPLRNLDDVHGGFVASSTGVPIGSSPVRALHLPSTHEDPTDRNVLPKTSAGGHSNSATKGQAGGTGKSGTSAPSEYRNTPFAYAPQSVGSHSTRGTVPWAPDSSKKPKHKKSYGLLGEYFEGENFNGKVMERRDANIDFTWTGVRVDPRIPNDRPYSVRWTGKVVPRFSETYTFYTASDDGVRLWVDGKLLVSNWTTHGPSEDTGQITLKAGQEYGIRIEYFENGYGEAAMKLYWQSPSQVKEYIPEKCLIYPEK